MAEQNLHFPYEFKELDPKDKAEIRRLFNSPHMDYVSVGPEGYKVCREFQEGAAGIYHMPVRTDDIFVVSFQRSGTTVTQELVWLLANNLDFLTAATTSIKQRYPFLEIFMFYNSKWRKEFIKTVEGAENQAKSLKVLEHMSKPVTDKLLTAPSPRFIKTHLPFSLLPPKLLDTAKVVYVARDPRDVAVSSYHLARLFTVFSFIGTFKEFWNLFIRDLITLTPFFDQVKEAWGKRHHPNMLFLFYEELTKDLPAVVRRVADFLGKELSAEQMEQLCDHLSIDNFKMNKSVNYEDLREFGMMAQGESFIRKGKAGGWREYFEDEMSLQAQQWIADNLRDTDLRFPSVQIL